MNKKNLIFAAVLYFGIGAVATGAAIAQLEDLKLTVPEGVSKIRVISTIGDDQVMNVKINVKPGQKFRIEVVE